MTARMLATLALSLGLTAFAGCSGTTKDTGTPADTTDQGDDDDDDAVEDTTHTGGGGGGSDLFVPSAVTARASFGYDVDAGTMVPVTIAGYGEVTPIILLEVGNAAWEASGFDPLNEGDYCIVILPLTNSDVADFVLADPTLWYGVEYAGDPILTDCTPEYGFEVDPAVLQGAPDIATFVTQFGPWGVGIGEMNPYGEDYAVDYAYASIPEGSFVGATQLNGLLDQALADGIAWAEEIDATGTTTGTYLTAAQIHPGNGIGTGYYNFFFFHYVTLAY